MSATFPSPDLVSVGAHRVLVWRLSVPMLAVSSTPLGGGVGLRSWVINVQVPLSYDRLDPAAHLEEIATELGLAGDGVGLLTAASVDRWTTSTEDTADGDPVRVDATVGISKPVWAAAADADSARVGTINLVARLGTRLSDAALINAVVTVTEAKTQALLDAGVDGTGTASDAVCLLCPVEGPVEPFGGPRSPMGAPLARVTYAAVAAGVTPPLARR